MSFCIDEDSDEDSGAAVVPREMPGRARKPVQYLEESDDEHLM